MGIGPHPRVGPVGVRLGTKHRHQPAGIVDQAILDLARVGMELPGQRRRIPAGGGQIENKRIIPGGHARDQGVMQHA